MQHLIPILEAATFTALLSLLVEYCLRERMIFGFWLNLLADWWLLRNDPSTYEEAKSLRDLTEKECLGFRVTICLAMIQFF